MTQQLPAFVVSFTVASLFYKLGSFALECVAFLATWFVLDVVATAIFRVFTRREPRHQPTA